VPIENVETEVAIMSEQDAVPFKTVLGEELDLIEKQREDGAQPPEPPNPHEPPNPPEPPERPEPHDPTDPTDPKAYRRARAMNLAGLAFSGGGIRSAVFNLGFIQGLANAKSLHLFDYLSTVSGGGYIGGWYSTLLRRGRETPMCERDLHKDQTKLATPPNATATNGIAAFPAPEHHSVRFVRRFSNYLTPKLGMSGDTMALLANMVRNVVVMQMMLVSLLLALLSGMLLLVSTHRIRAVLARMAELDPVLLFLPAVLGMVLALVIALKTQSRQCCTSGELPPPAARKTKYPNTLILVALLAAMFAGTLFALGLQVKADLGVDLSLGWRSMLVLLLLYVAAWWGSIARDTSTFKSNAVAGALLAGVALAVTLSLVVSHLPGLLQRAPIGHIVAFAPVISFVFFSLVITIHLAVAGPAILEQSREWWARAGGQGFALSLAWALAYAFLLYAPPLIQYGKEWSVTGGGLWVVLTGIGAKLSKSGATGGEDASPWRDLLARLAPWVFLIGLLGLVAWAYTLVLFGGALYVAPGSGWQVLCDTIAIYQRDLGGHSMRHIGLAHGLPLAALAGGLSFGLFITLVKAVDLNLFSAHAFYTNRLARTFLGATREERAPNPYTGFDAGDDMPLQELQGQRPIHLFNANLNLTGGQELAWQTRRGASFVFTPGYCGYSSQSSLGEPFGGFRPTAKYAEGKITVATAMAVSGAAASPNMGFHTSTAVSALLTAFNLRLARWCPNPTREHWPRLAPEWSVGPLFSELTGEANAAKRWINLSDGGHFENLGLYELIRRRAALIVVTDLSEDGDYQFDDLAMAVRKLSVDFGVRLEFAADAFDAIRPPKDQTATQYSERLWAVGRIHYPDGEPGVLLYVKSALCKDAPIDIRQYRDANPTFPHESTADQWFDEDQFEAYRHLGQCAAEAVCKEWLGEDHGEPARARVMEIESKLRMAFQ
jgi:hypothetical protein